MKIDGEMRDLWRAADHGGEVLESFVVKERDKAAALKFIKKTPMRYGPLPAIVTDSTATCLSGSGAPMTRPASLVRCAGVASALSRGVLVRAGPARASLRRHGEAPSGAVSPPSADIKAAA